MTEQSEAGGDKDKATIEATGATPALATPSGEAGERIAALEAELAAARAGRAEAIAARRDRERDVALGDLADPEFVVLPVIQSVLQFDEMGGLKPECAAKIEELRKNKPHLFRQQQTAAVGNPTVRVAVTGVEKPDTGNKYYTPQEWKALYKTDKKKAMEQLPNVRHEGK